MTISPPKKTQVGSFLLESLISLLLFMIGVIALFSVSAQSLNQVGQSKYRNDASNLVGELVAEMWVSGAASPSLYDATSWRSRVAATLPDGQAVLAFNGNQVDFDVSWIDAKQVGTRHRYITSAQIAK